MNRQKKIEATISKEIKDYFKDVPKNYYKNPNWIAPIGGGYYDYHEITAVTKAYLHGSLSTQRPVIQFEDSFSAYVGNKYGIAVNSGTSANILAFNTLLETGDLKKGDEVAVPATTFISVVTPIIQLGLKPVYIDVQPDTLNMDMDALNEALTKKNNIKCVMVVHTLGCPADMSALLLLAKTHKLKIIEDCCEAHGAKINGKMVGSFGDMATWSFYVAHNMTTGEGGMIQTNSETYNEILRDLREFGRDRMYKGTRYSYSFGNLKDFDERYTFHKVGWNFRMADAPATFGLEQLKKLNAMNALRIKNAEYLLKNLKEFEHVLGLPPRANGNFVHTYYTFPIVIKDPKKIVRKDFAGYLESQSIETRAIMCGTLPDQPGLAKAPGRSVGNLRNSRYIRDNAFSIGCHPLLGREELDHVIKTIKNYIKNVD